MGSQGLLSATRLSSWPLVLFGLSVVLVIVEDLHYLNFTIDDAFISFRYAHNLAAGQGLVFNPGERVEGYSNFLWTVLLAVPAWLGVERFPLGLAITAKVLGTIFGVATMFVLWRTALFYSLRRPSDRQSMRWAAPVFLACSGVFSFWAMSGLETSLLSLLTLLAVTSYLRDDIDAPSRPRVPRAPIYVLLASLTHPEAVVLLAAMVLFRAKARLTCHASWRLWRGDLLWCAWFVVPYGLYLCWRLAYYGNILPNTYYAKLGEVPSHVWTALAGTLYVLAGVQSMALAGVIVVALLPLVLDRRGTPHYRFVALALGIEVTAVIYMGGDWMPAYRFLIPLLPLLALLFADGMQTLHALATSVVGSKRKSWLRSFYVPGSTAVALLLCLLVLLGATRTVNTEMPDLASGFVTRAPLHIEAYGIGLWLRANVPEHDLVALDDIGAIPYVSGVRVLDMLGLTDPHIAHLHGTHFGKFDTGYVLDQRPDYILLAHLGARPNGTLTSTQISATDLLADPRFVASYTEVPEFTARFQERGFRLYQRQDTAQP